MEAWSAWLLEAASEAPWGTILSSPARTSEDLEFVASTLGLRAAAAAAAAAAAPLHVVGEKGIENLHVNTVLVGRCVPWTTRVRT